METKKLIKNIRKYNPHCEHITLSTIFMKMKVDQEKFNVINWGPAGTGKSYSSIEFLEKLDLGTDIIIDNNTTKRGLFDLLNNYPEQDFILDECSAILRDQGTQDMIKLAMESKPITWVKKDSVEVTPSFKGNFILNVNHALMDSLTDRSFVNKTLMNKKMALDFVDYYIDKDSDEHELFIRFLRRKLKKNKKINLTKHEVNYVRDFVYKQINMSDEKMGFSRRTVIRMLSYFRRVKRLFEKLDDEIKTFIEPYAAIYVENKRTPTAIEILLGDEKMDKINLIRLVANETGYSERHARRLVDEELTKGNLQQFGRKVFVK